MWPPGVQQVATHCHEWIQACHRILKYQSHRLTAQSPQISKAEVAGIVTVQAQLSFAIAAWGQQLQTCPGHRAFAAAGGTHYGHKVAPGYFQVGAVYEIYGLTIFLDGEANVFQFEHWLRWV